MATTQVELVTPSAILWSGQAEMVVCWVVEGEIAFLADHAPYLGALSAGTVRILTEGGGEERFDIGGGFVEVHDNRVILLADTAEAGAAGGAARTA
ncbi:MAG TPA: ATP synthase F1 subunit epsilon [Acidimicrobiales bacterium]|nr:ATP synthase F1 subunit epsilon [Acidimicrobiales bacterium]